MARKAKFRVFGRFDGRAKEATVTIDRLTNLIAVRPLHRRRTYELPLAAIAQMIVYKVVVAELAEKKHRRKNVRRGAL